jgi:nicotinate-nucleotide pyrophosphorylase (carboxylating)
MALIRSGHIAIAGGLAAALESLRQRNSGLQVVVEVQSGAQLDEALPLEPDRIMLTGMSVREIAGAVHRTVGRVTLEVAGEVSLQDVRAIAETGVDYISVSALTQQAVALPMGLEMDAP